MRIIPSAFWLLAIVVVPVIMAGRSHVIITEDDVLWTTLSDGSKFPLVGLGVGNLQHDLIADQITTAVQTDKKMFLFDTAHASDNEAVVRDGIVKGLEAYYPDDKTRQIHVVTKVWYTHLGYERTKLSVKASLENLNHPNIKVHILIHWPRCNVSSMQSGFEYCTCVLKTGPFGLVLKIRCLRAQWYIEFFNSVLKDLDWCKNTKEMFRTGFLSNCIA